MKMSVAVLLFAHAVNAQDYPAGQLKHLSVPVAGSVQPLAVAATEISREGVQYPSVIHLKGNVEIKMPVCVSIGPGSAQRCTGKIVFRADEADLHEESGQIDAKGSVRVTREGK
jgi:hypothetical protein